MTGSAIAADPLGDEVDVVVGNSATAGECRLTRELLCATVDVCLLGEVSLRNIAVL